MKEKRIVEIYAKKQLDTIFLSRLKTQDRVYEDFIYPIKLIDRFFKERRPQENKTEDGKDNRLDELFLKELQEMQMILENGEVLLYENLYLLKIETCDNDYSVAVATTKDDNWHGLYTNTADDHEKPRRLIADMISKVSIDHIVPMHNLIRNANLTEFGSLSAKFGNDPAGWKGQNYIELSNKYNCREFRNSLLTDLKALAPQYQLMELRENIKKNKKESEKTKGDRKK